MVNSNGQNILLDGPIYTSAQSGTNIIDTTSQQPYKIVYGQGTDISDHKAMQGKARRKLMSRCLAYYLAQLAKERGDKKREQQYWNTWHCYTKLIKVNGRTYGNYCKNRWCLVCLANRKANLINKYYPTLCQWENLYFVTLTVRSVPAHQLRKWLEEGMLKAFQLIKDKYRKRHQRGKGIKLMGVRSLECNYNPIAKTYNPHFHIIVRTEEMAEILIEEWKALWTKKHTYHKAQHKRPVRNLERDLVETIKYGSKIFTEPDKDRAFKSAIPPKIYAAALDTIFTAMDGLRVFDRFGFNRAKQEPTKPVQKQVVTVFEEIEYDKKSFDWLNYDTGEMLAGYVPTGKLQWLLKHNVDMKKI